MENKLTKEELNVKIDVNIKLQETNFPEIKQFMDRIRKDNPDMYVFLRGIQKAAIGQSLLRQELEDRITLLEKVLLKRN